MELTRFFIDCGNYLISVFSTPCIFSKLSLGQRVLSLAFIDDFGLRKAVLRAEICFAIIELYRKKSKNWIFCDFCWRKNGFLVSDVFLEVIFGTEKMANLEIKSFASLGKLSDPGLLYNRT